MYDASVRKNSRSLSLNDCLETDPAPQKILWSNLIRTKFKSIALCGDLQKAFLQMQIKKEDYDALKFNYVQKEEPN